MVMRAFSLEKTLCRFFLYSTVAPNGCWIWIKSRHPSGYGQFRANNKAVMAHRYAYQTFVGDIPAGLDLDHLCRNPACCNPFHLEPVTRKENLRRGIGNSGKTHCKRGHQFTEHNTWIEKNGARHCKVCRNENARAWRATQ
jgi:HNH endonuclease